MLIKSNIFYIKYFTSFKNMFILSAFLDFQEIKIYSAKYNIDKTVYRKYRKSKDCFYLLLLPCFLEFSFFELILCLVKVPQNFSYYPFSIKIEKNIYIFKRYVQLKIKLSLNTSTKPFMKKW